MADQGEFDEHVAVTIRTAVDEWQAQNDPADDHGVSMQEYIRRALADAGLLTTARLEQLTAEVERLKDVDAEAFGSRFLIQSYDIELGRTARTLARLLTEAGISPPPEGPWHLAHRVKEEFQAVVRQRDEALAALEKQQGLLSQAVPVTSPQDPSLPRVWTQASADNEPTDCARVADVSDRRWNLAANGHWESGLKSVSWRVLVSDHGPVVEIPVPARTRREETGA